MVVTFSLEPNAFFLKETGIVENGDVKMGLKLDPEYLNYFLSVKERYFNIPVEERIPGSEIQKEVDYVTTQKKFVLPILNRGSKSSFEFLIATNNVEIPILSIGIYEPSVRLVWHESIEKKKKRRIWKNVFMFLSWIGLACLIIRFAPSVTWAVCLMFVNSFLSYFIGAFLLYLSKMSKIT